MMAKAKRMPRKKDIRVYKAAAVRTKTVNRSGANAHGGIRF